MSTIIQSKPNYLNQNIISIFNYLDRQYPTSFDLQDIEQDISDGMTSLTGELHNAYKALVTLKRYHKNDTKVINQYLKLLMRENKIN